MQEQVVSVCIISVAENEKNSKNTINRIHIILYHDHCLAGH